VLLADIRDLKTLNEVWGHDAGDRLLQSFAQRLGAQAPGFAARLGADEFVVLLEGQGAQEDTAADHAEATAHTLMAGLAHQHDGQGWRFECTCSAGLVGFNGHNGSVGELLQRAEIALYEAKADGPQSLRRYDGAMHAAVAARALLDKQLREALARREFELHYQPQLRADGRWLGAEALVRWRHPERGWVSPAAFIPACEESGLIIPLGRQVLEMACAALAQWRGDARLGEMVVAVNVSARQFRQPDFVRQVGEVLEASGAPAHRLKLELTESVMVDDVNAVVQKMNALRSRGVSFALDDFGTGYSSLGYLKRLPLEQLKIDQSFVRDVLSDPNDATIARTVIALGQSLGLDVVAEGVETEAQRAFLLEHGCHGFQGYLFSRPLPRDGFEALVAQRDAPG
jgi:diguanylate cyclase (GGDEF)-like protein